MDYKIAIPSHNRIDILNKKTYNLLISNGINENQIDIFVAPDQVESYKKAFPKSNIIKSKLGFIPNKRFLHSYYKDGTKLITMDDDVSKIVQLENDKIINVKSLKNLINKMFEELSKNKFRLAGLYPVANSMFMKNAQPITKDLRFIYAPFRAFINDPKLLPNYEGPEDYEITLLYYLKYGGVLRFNKFSLVADYETSKSIIKKDDREKSKKLFYEKYKKYISKIITHKDKSTSFVFKKNPD
jgi:hypothetical protein